MYVFWVGLTVDVECDSFPVPPKKISDTSTLSTLEKLRSY